MIHFISKKVYNNILSFYKNQICYLYDIIFLIRDNDFVNTKINSGENITLRAIIISIISVVLCIFWIRETEMISFSTNISESVFPIPAFTVLIFLFIFRMLLNKIGLKLHLTRSEILFIFIFVMVGSVMAGIGVTPAFLPYLTIPFYFATPQNNFSELSKYLPDWLVVKDTEAARMFFEGSTTGIVPWNFWLCPLVIWLCFFLIFSWTIYCVWVLFKKQWVETERLSFPLIILPLRLTEDESIATDKKTVPLYKNPLLWLGITIAGLYQIFNILNSFDPNIPALGNSYSMANIFIEPPMNVLKGVQVWYRPELIGFGYLMPTEILFSSWFFFFLENTVSVLVYASGIRQPGFPYLDNQAVGAYLGLGFITIFVARKHLVKIIKSVFSKNYDTGISDQNEPLTYKTAFWGVISGVIAMLIFSRIIGMSLMMAIYFFGTILLVLLVYGRIRAETGVPLMWLFPSIALQSFPLTFFGTAALKIGGTMQSIVALNAFSFLVRGGFFCQTTVYQLESMKLAEDANLNKKHLTRIIFFAIILGLILSFATYLPIYYQYGANMVGGGRKGAGAGGTRVNNPLAIWNDMSKYSINDIPRNDKRNVATFVGTGVVLSLFFSREIIYRFPLNPIGYLMSLLCGNAVWFPFLLVWFIKSIIMHVGGIKLYKTLIPLFLGIAVGQLVFTGIIFAVIAYIFPEIRYHVYFA